MHKEILDFMLANTCRNEGSDQGTTYFTFDLHCMEITVHAECLTPAPWDDTTVPEYKILSYTTKEI